MLQKYSQKRELRDTEVDISVESTIIQATEILSKKRIERPIQQGISFHGHIRFATEILSKKRIERSPSVLPQCLLMQ